MSQGKNWIITDGLRFIYKNYKGKYVYASGESMAEHFTKQEAEYILNHRLSKKIRNGFRIECICPAKQSQDMSVKVNEKLTVSDFQNGFQDVMSKDSTQQWLEKLESFNGMLDEARNRKTVLSEHLSKVDRALSVLDHIAETTKANASQGWFYWSLNQQGQRKRREIKNEIAVIDIILNSNVGQKTVQDVRHKIEKLDERKYTPKELVDLFQFKF